MRQTLTYIAVILLTLAASSVMWTFLVGETIGIVLI